MTNIPVLDGREIPEATRIPELLSRLGDLATGASIILIAPHDPKMLLQKLIAQFPKQLNWGPVEKGPDVWRWQFTGRDAGAGRTVSEFLGWDHRRLEDLFAAGMTAANADDWDTAQARLAEHRVGLLHHADIEDAILFPAYNDATGNMPGGPTEMMIEEHRGVRTELANIAGAVKDQNAEDLADAHQRLDDVLTQHHAQEEEILFPSMDETFPADQLNQLIEKLLLA